MITISEWLPNPKGTDTKSEWIELWNSGNTAIDWSGWRLTADTKKFFTLQGTIGPGERKLLKRGETKITLKNTDGRLALYDASGRLADQAAFMGSAPEGQSINRGANGTFFSQPTPGAPNAKPATNMIIGDKEYPIGVPLGAAANANLNFAGAMLGTALALSIALVFILKSHAGLSHIFFGGYQSSRREAGPADSRGRS